MDAKEPVPIAVRYRGAELTVLTRPWKRSDASVADEVLKRRCYERHGVRLADCTRWLDAGAHIGCFSLAAARNGCRVDAFEPEPDNALLFERNTAWARPLVTLHQAALLSEPAEQETTLYLAPRSTSFHSTLATFRRGDAIRVPVVGFEAFLRANPDVDGLKVDVQGAEMPMLESLCRHPDLLAPLKQIVFEWDFHYDRSTARLLAVMGALEQAGFLVFAPMTVCHCDSWNFWPEGVVVHARRPSAPPPRKA